MNIIVLIIASDDWPQYIEMEKLWRTYMNNHPNIKSYFIKCNPGLEINAYIKEDENTIYIKQEETYRPGILSKTIESIDFFLKNTNFDYIYRTNLSTVLDLHKLYEYVVTNKIDYGGVTAICGDTKTPFISGSGFFISNNACQYLINNKTLIDYNIIDDVAIGMCLHKIYNFNPIQRLDVLDKDLNNNIYNKEYFNNTNIFQIRCNTVDHTHTVDWMNKFIKIIYN
jgi:hypothetical protein